MTRRRGRSKSLLVRQGTQLTDSSYGASRTQSRILRRQQQITTEHDERASDCRLDVEQVGTDSSARNSTQGRQTRKLHAQTPVKATRE